MGVLIPLLKVPIEIRSGSSGSVTRKKGSKKLYVSFYYHEVRIMKSTGLNDTPQNERKMREWLDEKMEMIANGSFVFAEAFPGASEEEKAFHAAREGWEYRPEPHNVLFENYVAAWRNSILANEESPIKRDNWNSYIDCWLLPYFGKKTFHQIHGVEIKKFLKQLKCLRGARKGEPLSRSRATNLMIPLRAIWSDACEENHWDIPDPFRFVRKHLPEGDKKQPEGFRFEDYTKTTEQIDPFYLPHVEIMVMTGMIASELAGFRKGDIVNGEMEIRNSIVLGYEKEKLKTKYRKRRLPITEAIKQRLDILMARAEGEYLFTMEGGLKFDNNSFGKYVWKKAFELSGVKYRCPYSLRHSHAAWALAIGTPMDKMVSLMGHGSRQMIYEVYGKYIPGIEADVEKIRRYFGEDFK